MNEDTGQRTISGQIVHVIGPDPVTLRMDDIAWSLGRQLRYNGHMQQDYTVAHHCVIMSYVVPPPYALEALLHDSGEAYMGDITWPVKQLFPELEEIESELTYDIMDKYGPSELSYCLDTSTGSYVMSDVVRAADELLYQHECFAFGDRPGVYNGNIQIAWQRAIDDHVELWGAAYYPFIHRYYELIGADVTRAQINEAVEPIWYKNHEPETDEQTKEAINKAARDLL